MALQTSNELDEIWEATMKAFSKELNELPPPDKAAGRFLMGRADIEVEAAEQSFRAWVNDNGTPAQITWVNTHGPFMRDYMVAASLGRKKNGTAVL